MVFMTMNIVNGCQAQILYREARWRKVMIRGLAIQHRHSRRCRRYIVAPADVTTEAYATTL